VRPHKKTPVMEEVMTGVKGESTAYVLTYQCPACGEISKLSDARSDTKSKLFCVEGTM